MKYTSKMLRDRRSITESKLFCDAFYKSLDKDKFKKFLLKKSIFNKEFYEEYYPLSLYANLKFPKENYFVRLCKENDKSDAEISIATIQ